VRCWYAFNCSPLGLAQEGFGLGEIRVAGVIVELFEHLHEE
jgi:hypothetical protein